MLRASLTYTKNMVMLSVRDTHSYMDARKPAECVGCPLAEVGEGFAWGDGDPNSDTWLIGEALGENEVREGRPFVGGSGRYLNSLLQKAGIDRRNVYLTNILRCRPPGNVIEPWLPRAADHCSQYLDRDFSVHRPRVIIAIGGTALERLTGFREGIYAGRGCVFADQPLAGIRTIGTLHPAELIRASHVTERKQKRHREAHPGIVVSDLRRAAKERWLDPFKVTATIPTTPKQVEEWFACAPLELSCDIETSGRTTICIGFGYSNADGDVWSLCVPFFNADRTRAWDYDGEVRVVRAVADVLSSDSIAKAFHNGYSFDVPMLEDLGFMVNNWEDTILMHHLKYAELPHKLRFLGSVYTRLPYWKGDAKVVEDELDK